MKLIIVVAFALVAVAVAAPPSAALPESPKIIKSEFNFNPDGGYNSAFETENGIQQAETGELKVVTGEDNKPQTVLIARGSYSYPDPTGKLINIVYYADETGFHAQGDSIPKTQ